MSIDDIDAEAPAPIEVEPDPIDTDKPEPATTETEPESSTDSDDKSLFGLLIPLGESVKLDPSVDRQVLRAQTVRLKELGYEFDAKCQTWKKR